MSRYQHIERDLLVTHPLNPREELNDLEQLADSIRKYGVLQPLTVVTHGTQYRVLAGHRRLAAAVMAGLTTVPCLIREETADSPLAVMLTENLQRRDLNPIEEAQGLQALANFLSIKPTDLYPYIHKNVDHVARRLLLLELTPEEQDDVATGRLKLGAAERLARQRRSGRRDLPGRRSDEWTDEQRAAVHAHYFGHAHPLAAQAQTACSAAHHSRRSRIGGAKDEVGTACGPCWESAIRIDERRATEAVAS